MISDFFGFLLFVIHLSLSIDSWTISKEKGSIRIFRLLNGKVVVSSRLWHKRLSTWSRCVSRSSIFTRFHSTQFHWPQYNNESIFSTYLLYCNQRNQLIFNSWSIHQKSHFPDQYFWYFIFNSINFPIIIYYNKIAQSTKTTARFRKEASWSENSDFLVSYRELLHDASFARKRPPECNNKFGTKSWLKCCKISSFQSSTLKAPYFQIIIIKCMRVIKCLITDKKGHSTL